MTYAYKLICAKHTKSPEIFYGRNWHSSFVARIFSHENILRHQRQRKENFPAWCVKRKMLFTSENVHRCCSIANEFFSLILLRKKHGDFLSVLTRVTRCDDRFWHVWTCFQTELHNLCSAIVVCYREFFAADNSVACVQVTSCTLTPWGQTEMFLFLDLTGSYRANDMAEKLLA